jgi:EAL domain-containing protein (putative c-di-GMP-specific phosphodiesterase class I)
VSASGRLDGLDVLEPAVPDPVQAGPIWDRLSALGCTVAQGYFLSRPLPADELTPWLERRRDAPGS